MIGLVKIFEQYGDIVLVSTPPHVFAKVPLNALHFEVAEESELNEARQSPCGTIGRPGRGKERNAEDPRARCSRSQGVEEVEPRGEDMQRPVRADYKKDTGAGSRGTDQQFWKARMEKGKRLKRVLQFSMRKSGRWKQSWNGRKQGLGKMWCFYYEYVNHQLKARVRVASIPLGSS